jgi:hypothetical protein
MSEKRPWREHVETAVSHIKTAMDDIATDGPNAWKEGLLIEAVHKLENANMDEEDQDAD